MQITRIAMHEGPHLDEILACVLLRVHGEKRFPGVSQAKLIFWSYGGEVPPDGPSAQELFRQGTLLLGQGFGPFDEHPCPERGIARKSGESTSSLVARVLGYYERGYSPVVRAVRYLVKLVTEQDLNGSPGLLTIEQTLSAMSRDNVPSDKMFVWGAAAVTTLIHDQISFQQEFDRAAGGNYHYRLLGDCEPFRLAVVESDSEHACRAARTRGAHLVIRRDSRGHVTVMKDTKTPISTGLIVAELRRLELATCDQPIPPAGDPFWVAEGRCAGWYYHPIIGLITTGGNRTARLAHSPLTPFAQIESAVISVIEQFLQVGAPALASVTN